MKNLLLTSMFVVVSIGVYSQTASLGTYPSTTSGQTYRKINDYLGLNGANTLLTSSAFANTNVNKILAEFRPSYLRFPGGTFANYWDWQEGWFFRYMNEKGCMAVLPEYQKRIRFQSVFTSSTLNTNGSDYLEDFKTAITKTGAKPLFVINPLTSDLNYQLAMLLQSKELNLAPNRVEIGNEFFLSRCAYQKKFKTAFEYGELVDTWRNAIHDYVGPRIKVSAVGSNLDNQSNADDRRNAWNADLNTQLSSTNLPEAYSIHHYRDVSSFTTLNSTVFDEVFSNVTSDVASTQTYISQLNDPEDIWLTEYSLFSPDKIIHGTWYHGLYNAYLTLKLLDIESISMCNMHSMAGDYIFSGFFNNNHGFNCGTTDFKISAADFCTPCSNTPPATVAYGRSAAGMTSSLIAEALMGKVRAKPITFSSLPSGTSFTSTSESGVYGWVFMDNSNNIQSAIILNLSDIDVYDLEVSSLFSRSDFISQLAFDNPEYLVAETGMSTNSYDFFEDCSTSPTTIPLGSSNIASVYPSGISAKIVLPKFSITELYSSHSPDRLRVFASQDTIVAGTEVILTADNDTNYWYRWNTGDTTFYTVASPTADSTFRLDIVAKGTSTILTTKYITVIVKAPIDLDLQITMGSNSVCSGSEVHLEASVNLPTSSNYKYVWITGPVDDNFKRHNEGLQRNDVDANFLNPNATTELVVNPILPTLYTVYCTDGYAVTHASVLIDVKDAIQFEEEYRLCINEGTIILDPLPEIAHTDNIELLWSYGGDHNTQFTFEANTGVNMPLDQTNENLLLELTVDGCVSNYAIPLMVTRCCEPISGVNVPSGSDVNGIIDVIDATDENGTVTYTCGGGNETDIYFEGISTIKDIDRTSSTADTYFTDELILEGCNLHFGEGARLDIAAGYTLRLDNCALDGCDNITWQGIRVDNGTLVCTGSSTAGDTTSIKLAEYAIDLKQGSTLRCKRTKFNDNLISIKADQVDDENGFNYVRIGEFIYNDIHGCSASINPEHYVGQSMFFVNKPFRGMQFDGIAALIGPDHFVGTKSNTFFNLNEGIHANSSFIIYKGNQFELITGEASYPEDDGIGIHALAGENAISVMDFTGLGKSSAGAFTFADCTNGIITENTQHTTDSSFFRDVDFGVSASLNDLWSINITDNTINSDGIGVNLMNNDLASSLKVMRNEINFGGLGHAKGIVLSDYGLDNDGAREIFCNEITALGNGSAGIEVLNPISLLMFDNSISLVFGMSLSSGVICTNASYSTLYNNRVDGRSGSINRAFHFTDSPDNSIFNNFSDNSVTGFKFSGTCTSIDQFKQNEIGNHDFGLVVDDDAIIGTQYNTGNEWTGSYSTWAAKNFETFAPNVALSRFDVGGGSYTPSSFDPAGWFNFPLGLTYSPASIDNYDCDGFDEENDIVLNGNDAMLARGETEFNSFPDEEEFTASQYLLGKIKNASENAMVEEVFIDFKDSLETTSINFIDSSMMLFSKNQLAVNLTELNTSINKLQAELSTSSDNDQDLSTIADFYFQTNRALSQLRTEKALNNSTIDALVLASSDNLLPEVNEKYMLNIYKNYFNEYSVNFSAGEVDSLISIAMQCPLQGGKAVYRARAALRWVTDTLEYDDITTCSSSPLKLRKTESTSVSVILEGNPLAKDSKLRFSQALVSMGYLQILNVQGQIISEKLMAEKTLTYNLTGLNLPAGLYVLKVSSTNLLTSLKLVVQ